MLPWQFTGGRWRPFGGGPLRCGCLRCESDDARGRVSHDEGVRRLLHAHDCGVQRPGSGKKVDAVRHNLGGQSCPLKGRGGLLS